MTRVSSIVRAFLAVLTAVLLAACTSPTPTPQGTRPWDMPVPTYFTAHEVIDIVQYYLSTKIYSTAGGPLAPYYDLAHCPIWPEATWSRWWAQYVDVDRSWLVTRTVDWSKSPYTSRPGVLISKWKFYERTRIVEPFDRTSFDTSFVRTSGLTTFPVEYREC